jgi:signal transduction histidine kinase
VRGIRARLTLIYGGLFLAAGAALLTITYVLIAHFPVVAHNYATVAPRLTRGGHPPQPLPGLAALGSAASRQRAADLHHLVVESGIALGVMAVVSLALGWLMAGRVLLSLRSITATTRQISASSLHLRLALPGPDDELKELGDTIDALLTRLERSFAVQRQFVANASHELRTPLTLERALLEAALTDPEPTASSWRTACERALAAGAQQERLIDALLTLARGDAGLDQRELVDLSDVARRVTDLRRDEAADRGLRLELAVEPALVHGDPHLLERLVANLVDNAVRHNTEAGWIRVRARQVGVAAALSVSNTGPVVADDDVARLLRPFQRLTRQRTDGSGGFGLGLSIVEAIAAAHDADLTVTPRPAGGLVVAVGFPPGSRGRYR